MYARKAISITLFVLLVLGLLQIPIVRESSAEDDPEDIGDIEIEEADLSLTLEKSATVTAGGILIYIVTVTNYGPNNAENVVVQDYLPDDVSFVNATPRPSCKLGFDDYTVRCDIDAISPDSSAIITISVKVHDNAVETMRNFAEVYSDADDPNFDNDSDYVDTNVNVAPSSININLDNDSDSYYDTNANVSPSINMNQTPVQEPTVQQISIPAHVLESIKQKSKPAEPVGKLQVISANSGKVINSFPDKIIIRNVGNGIADNIRVILSSEISKSFRLSETAIRSIEPNNNVTITLELNGNPNHDTLGNMLGYKGNLMVLGEHHSPIFLPVNIGAEESYYLSSYMDNVASKAEKRFNKISLLNSILSKQTKTQYSYEVKASDGENVITNPSGEIVIKNLSEKELKNIRIELSTVGHPFLLEQNVIRSLDPNGEINIKLISKLGHERYSSKDIKGELLLIPSNDKPIHIPIEIVGEEQNDSANEFDVKIASNHETVTSAVEKITIKNLDDRTMDSVKLMLSSGLDRILQLNQDSFRTIKPGQDITVELTFRSILGEKKEAFTQNYVGELTIVSEHHNKNMIPITMVWKEASSKHFTVYARNGDESIADQVVKLLEINHAKLTSRFGEMKTKTVVYITSSMDEMNLINTDGHSYYSRIDDAVFVCSCDDPEYNALKQFVYKLIVNNYPSYHNMEKIVFDKENWLVDGIASYVATSIVTAMSDKYVETFVEDDVSLQWYGYGGSAQYGATYTFFDYLHTKYGDLVIQKALKYLGSGMISNHRCSTLENCVVLRAVYDMNGLDLDDKRHSLNFDRILKEWEDYKK